MAKDTFGDFMKSFEPQETLMRGVPIVARLDGRSFSKATKNLKRPFDEEFNNAMRETAKYLAEAFCASVAYCQSDEITLVFLEDWEMFSRRSQKLSSTLASMASVKFAEQFGEKMALATFDCRVFAVPNRDIAMKQVVWREKDATKNSINTVAWVEFGAKEIEGLSCKEKQEKLFQERGINWNNLPEWQKRGNLFIRKECTFAISDDVWNQIPVDQRGQRIFTRVKLTEYGGDPISRLLETRSGEIMNILFNEKDTY